MTTSVTRKKLPLRCPACDAPLRVSKMICGRCATEVSGEFELPVLTSLNEEEQRFMLEFVKASGSLKDMAKKMGVSRSRSGSNSESHPSADLCRPERRQ